MNNFKVILIGNYACDKQVSMNSFLNILVLGLKNEGFELEIWKPNVCFGYFVKNTNKGIGKWFGYIDKYVLTTIYFYIKVLIHKLTQVNCVYHICDHSNSIYISLFPLNKILVTCHDVLAIRGALGFKDAFCEASGFGKILQHFILKNLKKNINIAFVSQNTKNQFIALRTNHFQNKYQVIYNGLNADFKKLEVNEANTLMQKYSSFPTQKYILHVGSNLTRKNRVLLVKMIYELRDKYDGLLCFAGQKPGLSSEGNKICVDGLDKGGRGGEGGEGACCVAMGSPTDSQLAEHGLNAAAPHRRAAAESRPGKSTSATPVQPCA
jgi:hypothetical protein